MNIKITEQKYRLKGWFSKTRTLAILALSFLLLTACGNTSSQTMPEGTALVEIIYLNHGPVRSLLTEIDVLLVEYGDKVVVERYDFSAPEGEAFAEERNLKNHTPIVIYINGKVEFSLDGRTVEFNNFPQGQGTGVVPDGNWSLDDLQTVLDMITSEDE